MNQSHSGNRYLIVELANMLRERKRLRQSKPVLLLGDNLHTESDFPTLERLYQAIAEKVGREDLATDFELLHKFVSSRANSLHEIYSQVLPTLMAVEASPGYHYLAQLVIEGYFDIILTLNFDTLVEDTLNQYLSVNYMKLVRNEHSDKFISEAVTFYPPRVKFLKLRGDLHGRSFMLTSSELARLPEKIEEIISNMIATSDLLWVGAQSDDTDVISCIPSGKGLVWFVNRLAPEPDSKIARIIADKSMNETIISGELGQFDNFFRELYLNLCELELKPIQAHQRVKFNQQIRSKFDIDLAQSDTLIRRLATEIITKCDSWAEPTLLVYIHDPAAPGGSEVEKRIRRYLKSSSGAPVESIRLDVKGKNIRWTNREASVLPAELADENFARIVIIDSISFTGRTLSLATQSVKQLFPHAHVMWAVLVVSEQLVNKLDEFEIEQSDLLTVFETSRHDIYFPWGWTQATGRLTRVIDLYNSSHTVEINQRPWGTIEILAEMQLCSVRIHTIRPGHRLSFHRHLMRDELFVALDDNIGVEFESEDGQVVEAVLLPKGEYLAIPRGVKHRFAAHQNSVRLLEIAFGYYDQTYDIQRFKDDYGRLGKLGDV